MAIYLFLNYRNLGIIEQNPLKSCQDDIIKLISMSPKFWVKLYKECFRINLTKGEGHIYATLLVICDLVAPLVLILSTSTRKGKFIRFYPVIYKKFKTCFF